MTNRDSLIELIDETNDECDNKDCMSCKYWNTTDCKMVKLIDKIRNKILAPYKVEVGGTVYCFSEDFGTVLPYFVESLNISYLDKDRLVYQYTANCTNPEENELLDSIDFEPEDIGKTVFLSEKEAEIAHFKEVLA